MLSEAQAYNAPENVLSIGEILSPNATYGRIGQPEVIRFIRHATRWRRFFRCSLAASNFRSLSFGKSVRLRQRISFHLT
jgi:hypothetical protein